MPLLVGIDEAGFGPLLGPLVAGAATFYVPASEKIPDLWKILKKSTSNQKRNLRGRLLVCDSKKAHSKTDGIKHLQRVVLACLNCTDRKPENINDLLDILAAETTPRLGVYPWYQNLKDCAIEAHWPDIEIASKVFKKDMGENNLALQSLTCKCLDVAYYNKQVSLVKNKSKVLFSAIAELMYQIIKDSTDQKIHFLVDHQGGRTHYAGELLKLFAPDDITILAESAELSSYKLEFDKKCVNMTFLVKADLNHFAPALASMTSKYLREIMIHKLNTHFAGLDSTIKPTAGYWSDGKRFLSDLETKLAHIKIDKNILVRSR